VFIALLLRITCCGRADGYADAREKYGLLGITSDRSSTRHQVEDEHDDGKDEENVNPSAHRVTADESYDPEDEENDCDCPKHDSIS
jgi:hypothetical protein